MSYVIEKQIIGGLPSISLTARRFIIAHESGNASNCGNDSLERELSFMKRNCKNAFVSHWVGGGGRIVQVAPVETLQYGCGPKGNPYAYAQVELARTTNKDTFEKDYKAYIWLLCNLAKEAGLPITLDEKGNGIKTHRWITNNLGGTSHVDPYSYLASFGVTEQQFKQDILNGLDEESEEGMNFSSKSLKNETELTLSSKARLTMIVEAAIAAGANDSWRRKHENREMTEEDYKGLALKAIIDPQLKK